jgi:hypothetical protein
MVFRIIIIFLLTQKIFSQDVYEPILIRPNEYINIPYDDIGNKHRYDIINYENIGFHIKTQRNTYSLDEEIMIKCVLRNNTSFAEEILLKDNDIYHGKLDFPISFYITLKDNNNKILVEKYTPYIFWNTEFEINSEDWINLEANEEITKIIPLKKMLLSMKGNDKIITIEKGKYIFQLVLSYTNRSKEYLIEIYSNEIEIWFQ